MSLYFSNANKNLNHQLEPCPKRLENKIQIMCLSMKIIHSRQFRKIGFSLILMLGLSSCTQDDKNKEQCPITIDSVMTLLTQTYNEREYYLVKRISGWHEKTEIIQLFDQPPILNRCNEDTVPPIFEDSIELDKPLIKLSADIKNNFFELIYAESGGSTAEVILELRN